jgi:hypothetical protein
MDKSPNRKDIELSVIELHNAVTALDESEQNQAEIKDVPCHQDYWWWFW